MEINWFPGHMTKALRNMEKDIKIVDLIIYVLDARAPISCINPAINKIAERRPIIYVLNKADLVESKDLKFWQDYLSVNKNSVVALNSTASNSSKILKTAIIASLKEKIEAKKQKNVNMSIRTMVVGVPNCGKSTLINNLCGFAKTETGNRPGVTRGKQWVNIGDNIEVLDTPGTLWPSFENKITARNLAFIGSIKDNVLEITELAFSLIETVNQIKPSAIKERYGIDTEGKETLEIFDEICEVRKCLLRGGEMDYDRCAVLIIDDFRKGKMGKIMLDMSFEQKNKE